MSAKQRRNVDRPTMNLALKAAILATREHQKRIAQLAHMDESRLSQIINHLDRPANQKEQQRLLSILLNLVPKSYPEPLTITALFPSTEETAK